MKKCILALSLLLFGNAYADEMQSLDTLRLLVEKYVTENIGPHDGKLTVQVGKIDERLQLKSCPIKNLEVVNPYNTALIDTTVLSVSCNIPTQNWTMYIPIKLRLTQQVVTASHLISPNTVIGKNDLTFKNIDIKLLNKDYTQTPEQVIGMTSTVPLEIGTAIPPSKLIRPKVVFRGEAVSIRVKNQNLLVTMDGVALEDGRLGQLIHIKNNRSKRVVQGRVTGKQIITVEI